MTEPLVALIDIGKTNTKLSLVDPRSGEELRSSRRANTIIQTPLGRELDIKAIEQWLFDALRNSPHKENIRWIVPVAHGAAAVLLDAEHKVLAAPDYEDPSFESVNDAYRAQRDAFCDSCSPDLPLGLNLGRQLYFLQHTHPALFARAAHVLLYPQFWAWRLSGVMASEVTSLGCHSDIWLPMQMSFSNLAKRQGWDVLFPPRRLANDLLGTISPELVAATGLDPHCQVACGIHDSNASYLKFLIGRDRNEPFTVVSSGTWTVVMANRADLAGLREDRDMLANVDAFGSPVATARFMGGREYEAIAGPDAKPNMPALLNVVERQVFAVPAFASAGPFAGKTGKIVGADQLAGSERAGVATLYLALMTEVLIESLGARGDILIDGPLATNPFYGSLLAHFLRGRRVLLSTGDAGNTLAASYLAGFENAPAPEMKEAAALELKGLDGYKEAWRKAVSAG